MILFSFFLFACEGELQLGDMASPDEYLEVEPSPVVLRRLTTAQYENSIRDIFGQDLVIPAISEPDSMLGGFLSVGAGSSSYSPRGVESIEAAAYGIAKQVIENAEIREVIIPCTPQSDQDQECADILVSTLGERLWRRPLLSDEKERYTALILEAAQVYDDFYEGASFGIAGLIQSPNFLYRIELGEEDPDIPTQRRFTHNELAHRLAFFLWNTLPEEELLASAKDGSIATREGLFIQAKRMLDDERAKQGVSNFFIEYLRLYKLEDVRKDPTLFEHYSHHMAQDATTETLMFLEYLIFEQEGDFRESLTSQESFVNRRLAAIYNIPYSNAQGDFQYVRHPQERHRPGLLGQVSFLALHGHSVSTSATIRGSAVRSILLCQEIPPAPVDVDTSIPEASGETLTLRDRVAEHLENESCAGCHLLMDPIGLGLENYDSIGRWREQDNGALIDPSGDLDGAIFDNPTTLAHEIANHDNFVWCLSRGLARYANGREESRAEREHLDILEQRLTHHQYQIKPFLLEVVMSPLFRRAGSIEE